MVCVHPKIRHRRVKYSRCRLSLYGSESSHFDQVNESHALEQHNSTYCHRLQVDRATRVSIQMAAYIKC